MPLQLNIEKAAKIRALASSVPVGATFRERRPIRTKLEVAFKRTLVPYKKVLGGCIPMTEPLAQSHLDKLEAILKAVEFSDRHDLGDVKCACMIHIY